MQGRTRTGKGCPEYRRQEGPAACFKTSIDIP